MIWLFVTLSIILFAILITSLVCFMMVFYSPKRKPLGADEYEIPEGEIYEVFRDDMIAWTKEIRSMPHEDVEIRSTDGLTLRGKYFEQEGKRFLPLAIQVHHAVCDGYHVGLFVEKLQRKIAEFHTK